MVRHIRHLLNRRLVIAGTSPVLPVLAIPKYWKVFTSPPLKSGDPASYPMNQYPIRTYRDHPAAYGNPPTYRPSHHFDHFPVMVPPPSKWDVRPSLPGNVHILPNSQGYPSAADSFQGATPQMINMGLSGCQGSLACKEKCINATYHMQ